MGRIILQLLQANLRETANASYSNIPGSTGATGAKGASEVMVTPNAITVRSCICWKAVGAAGMIHSCKPHV